MANQQPDADSEIEQNQPQPNNPRAVPINSAELRKKVNAYRTLRGAVGKQVQKDAGGIAAALVESVKAGNSNSARIVVSLIDKRKPRNGRTVEVVGTYEPLKNPAAIKLDAERVKYWLSCGAQPSDTVRSFLTAQKIA